MYSNKSPIALLNRPSFWQCFQVVSQFLRHLLVRWRLHFENIIYIGEKASIVVVIYIREYSDKYFLFFQ